METSEPRVTLVAPAFGSPTEVWMYRQATRIARLRLRVIAWRRRYPEHYPAEGIDVEIVPPEFSLPKNRFLRWSHYLRNWTRDFYMGTAAEADWFVKRMEVEKPDVILAHYGPTALKMLPLAARLGIPVVAHFNGQDLSGAVRAWNYRWRLRRALPRLAGCVVVAEYMSQWLLANGAPAASVRKIPYGIPTDDYHPSEGLTADLCRFLVVGRLTEKKRPDLAIRAFARCIESGAPAQLVMIGDGTLRAECEQLTADLGISDRVEFLGFQPSDRVRQEMMQASAFVQHSVTSTSGDKEGWPVAIAEAAASGLPIIATQHASIPEQVEHGVGGLLCDEGDWQTMADHMIQLAKSPSLRQKMGHAARRHIAQYDCDKQIAALEDFLLETIDRTSR